MSLAGFGVEFYHSQRRKLIEIDRVDPGSPAYHAGLREGDELLMLAGVQVRGRETEGLKEAMLSVESLEAKEMLDVEWHLWRPPPIDVDADMDGIEPAEADVVVTAAENVEELSSQVSRAILLFMLWQALATITCVLAMVACGFPSFCCPEQYFDHRRSGKSLKPLWKSISQVCLMPRRRRRRRTTA